MLIRTIFVFFREVRYDTGLVVHLADCLIEGLSQWKYYYYYSDVYIYIYTSMNVTTVVIGIIIILLLLYLSLLCTYTRVHIWGNGITKENKDVLTGA